MSNETNELLRALLTTQVLTRANIIWHEACHASMPRMESTGPGRYENINETPSKSWQDCLQEATEELSKDQPTILQLLRDQGVLSG